MLESKGCAILPLKRPGLLLSSDEPDWPACVCMPMNTWHESCPLTRLLVHTCSV
jgi:hypothetical protein